MIWFNLILWYINYCWLFNFGPVFTYILNIYDKKTNFVDTFLHEPKLR